MDDDVYVTQLKEVFDSCDLKGNGFLKRDELIDLCQKLQLNEQIPKLLKEVLGDERADKSVYFDDFKFGFINILSQSIDSLVVVTDDDRSEWSEFDQVTDNHKYSEDEETCTTTKKEGSFNKHNGDSTSLPDEDDRQTTNFSVPKRRRSSRLPLKLQKKLSASTLDDWKKAKTCDETASSSLTSNSQMASDHIPPSRAEELRTIWDEVSVGETGYIDRTELFVVCQHIGMAGLDEQELDLLFDELDINHDGQVSFDEFLNGLLAVTKRSSRSASQVGSSDVTDHHSDSPSESKLRATSTPLNINHRTKLLPRYHEKQNAPTVDAFTFLMPGHINNDSINANDTAPFDYIDEKVTAIGAKGVRDLVSSVNRDMDGNINLIDLTAALNAAVEENGDSERYRHIVTSIYVR